MKEQKQQDQDDFNAVGKHASNKYYINQDKKDSEKMALRGGARRVAEDLRQKDLDKYKLKQEQMKLAADKRRLELAEADESKQKTREEK